jgi:hypothetical protein
MKTILGIKLAALVAVLSFLSQPLVLAHEKMMECMMKDGKVMTMEGKPMGTCVMMKDGKMMMTAKSGKVVPMKKDMTMPDGTKCMVDGTCVMKDGTKMTMKEGEVMDSQSKIYRIKGLTLGEKKP